jgi:hypothetical protein
MTHSNPRVMALLVDAMAINAHIEGMKVENAHRAATIGGVSYGEKDFLDAARQLEWIASALRNVE